LILETAIGRVGGLFITATASIGHIDRYSRKPRDAAVIERTFARFSRADEEE
jgi:hypothetical protein